jgi:proline dehydrogenase
MRAYVPFGTEWYPYYMRRMAERPANVGFVVKALLKETPVASLLLILAALLLLWVFLGRKRRR